MTDNNMTDNSNATATSASDPAPTSPSAPGPDDPRYGLAMVVDAVGNLMETTPASAMSLQTPCSEFLVKDLFEHLVMVLRRTAAIGRGEHWSSVDQEAQDSGWAESYRAAAHEVMEAWTDAAKLEQVYEVPWGEVPGAPLMYTYTAELAVHGWDVAAATGAEFTIDDDLLRAPLMAAQFIPADGRGTPEMPFDPVVDPGAGAPVLLQIAGWMGRQVA